MAEHTEISKKKETKGSWATSLTQENNLNQ